MPTKAQILIEKTRKGQPITLDKRIHYALTSEPAEKVDRIAKGLALTMAKLREKRIFTEEDLDAILLEIVE